MSFSKDDAAVGTRSSLRVPTVSTKVLSLSLLGLGYLTSLIIASHAWAFLISPFQSGDVIRTAELLFFWAGWLLMTVGAGAVGLDCMLGTGSSIRFLSLIALIHPLSVIAIQTTLRLRSGHWYLSYLTNNVWFLLSDIVIPILFLILNHVSQAARGQDANAEELTVSVTIA